MPPTHARVQCTLYHGTQIVNTDDEKMCNWATRPVDSSSLMLTRGNNPLNAGMAITPSGHARDEILGVEDETTWIRDLYKMQLQN